MPKIFILVVFTGVPWVKIQTDATVSQNKKSLCNLAETHNSGVFEVADYYSEIKIRKQI